MVVNDQTERMPLSEAAYALHKSWRAAYDMLLAGVLTGGKENGRWVVDAASVERIKREREPAA